MALFAAEYREDELEHSGLNLVSWGHVVLLIHLVPNKNARAILAKKSATNNWDAGQLWAEINKSFDESKRPPKNSFP